MPLFAEKPRSLIVVDELQAGGHAQAAGVTLGDELLAVTARSQVGMLLLSALGMRALHEFSRRTRAGNAFCNLIIASLRCMKQPDNLLKMSLCCCSPTPASLWMPCQGGPPACRADKPL